MDKARLISRIRPPTSDSCLTFWYNMNGRGIGSLNVYKKENNVSERIWSRSGDHKNRWLHGSIQFQSAKSYQVLMNLFLVIYQSKPETQDASGLIKLS